MISDSLLLQILIPVVPSVIAGLILLAVKRFLPQKNTTNPSNINMVTGNNNTTSIENVTNYNIVHTHKSVKNVTVAQGNASLDERFVAACVFGAFSIFVAACGYFFPQLKNEIVLGAWIFSSVTLFALVLFVYLSLSSKIAESRRLGWYSLAFLPSSLLSLPIPYFARNPLWVPPDYHAHIPSWNISAIADPVSLFLAFQVMGFVALALTSFALLFVIVKFYRSLIFYADFGAESSFQPLTLKNLRWFTAGAVFLLVLVMFAFALISGIVFEHFVANPSL